MLVDPDEGGASFPHPERSKPASKTTEAVLFMIQWPVWLSSWRMPGTKTTTCRGGNSYDWPDYFGAGGTALVEGVAGTSGSDFEQPTSAKETVRVSNASSFIMYNLIGCRLIRARLGAPGVCVANLLKEAMMPSNNLAHAIAWHART